MKKKEIKNYEVNEKKKLKQQHFQNSKHNETVILGVLLRHFLNFYQNVMIG